MPDDGAALDGQLAGDAVDKRGFAHTRQPDNACTHPWRQIQIDIPQRVLTSIELINGAQT
ncbi:hypothetical protein D3C81_2193910 [compost metagenome]